jgi:hypothetical protein
MHPNFCLTTNEIHFYVPTASEVPQLIEFKYLISKELYEILQSCKDSKLHITSQM